jgi:hypothetical protein
MELDNLLLRTAEAAKYATELGRRTSPSLLRKFRAKGVNDPGSKGPSWTRAPNGDCMYSRPDLKQWVSEYLGSCRPMAPAEPPAHLRSKLRAA